MAEEKVRVSGDISRDSGSPVLPTVNPATEKSQPQRKDLPGHPALYVIAWISLSSSVIVFNKWILSEKGFDYPILLTGWHMAFATFITQVLAKTTTMLDGRKTVKMTGRVFLRAMLPIGATFSGSLMFGNLAYLYLSVPFIQMLKATTPVATLLASWVLRTEEPNMNKLLVVSVIVVGVIIASFGEIAFVLIGVLYQIGGIVFEALRLSLVNKLLSDPSYKMDPLVSLYYYAPVCAVMNLLIALFLEVPRLKMADIYTVGIGTFIINALIAFFLNVSVVFLIRKTSGLALTLCGVLKDIIIVLSSVVAFGSVITPLQTFGYTIALGGMVWYKTGAEKIKESIAEAGRQWADFGSRRPVLRKIIVLFGVVSLIFALLGGFAPSDFGRQYLDKAKSVVATST